MLGSDAVDAALRRGVCGAAMMLAGMLGAGSAGAVSFDVYAQANSSSGGTGLDTGIGFDIGDTILVSVDPGDLWNAGALPRWSNADGLVADLFATGSDDSGESAGTLIGQDFGTWTQNGLGAPYGSLVGSIGSEFFLIGTSFSGSAPASGVLQLWYWDSNNGDNTQFITATVVPLPGALGLFTVALAGLGLIRRRQP